MATIKVETLIKLTVTLPAGKRSELSTKASITEYLTDILKELPEETVEVVSYTCDGEPVE